MKKEGARGDKKKVLSRVRRQKTFSISSNRVLLSLSPSSCHPAVATNFDSCFAYAISPSRPSASSCVSRLASQARALDPFTTETFPVSTFRLYVPPPPKRKAPFGITTDAARRSIGEGGDAQTGIMPRRETLLFLPPPPSSNFFTPPVLFLFFFLQNQKTLRKQSARRRAGDLLRHADE